MGDSERTTAIVCPPAFTGKLTGLIGKRARLARFIINDNYNFSDYDYFGGLSRDHHQQTSCGLWHKPAPMTRFIGFAQSGMKRTQRGY